MEGRFEEQRSRCEEKKKAERKMKIKMSTKKRREESERSVRIGKPRSRDTDWGRILR